MTSPVEQIRVQCPSCGEVYDDWYRPSINLDLDPGTRDDPDYLEQATSAACPHCQHKVELGSLIIDDGVWHLD